MGATKSGKGSLLEGFRQMAYRQLGKPYPGPFGTQGKGTSRLVTLGNQPPAQSSLVNSSLYGGG